MVRTSGNWLRDGKTLILDDAAIAGLEYTFAEKLATVVDGNDTRLVKQPATEEI